MNDGLVRGALDDKAKNRLMMVFRELKKGLKNLAFNRHRSEQYESYLTVSFGLLVHHLTEHGQLELQLEASTMFTAGEEVLIDDQRESNIIYPLWREGVRLLVIKPGITIAELLSFYQRVMGLVPVGDDLLSALWREGYPHIDWIAVESFDLGDTSTGETVQVEVAEVLQALQASLRSDSEDGIEFGRVSLVDLDADALSEPSESANVDAAEAAAPEVVERLMTEQRAHEGELLSRAARVVVDVLRDEGGEGELAGVEDAVESVVDLLLLEGLFGAIQALVDECERLARDSRASTVNRELGRRLAERIERMQLERSRMEATVTALNTWRVDDEGALRAQLSRYARASPAILLGLLEQLKGPRHRKLVADMLVEAGPVVVPLVGARLSGATGDLRRDLFRVIMALDPPNKLDIIRPLLDDEDAATRADALAAIAATGGDDAFQILRAVLRSHRVAQLRAQAARIVADSGHPAAAAALLDVARSEKFVTMADGERAAFIAGLSRVPDDAAGEFLDDLVSEKASLLNRRKVDDKKLAVIRALAGAPGLRALERLARIGGDEATHSQEVREAAKRAALRMREALMSEGAQSS